MSAGTGRQTRCAATTLRAAVLALPLLLPGAPATAQESLPRVGALSVSYLRNGEDRYRVLRQTPGKDSTPVPFATWTSARTIEGRGARAMIHRVATFAMTNGVVIDSMSARLPSLAPVDEISHQPSKLMHLHFDGARVTGVVTPTIGAPIPISAALAEPVFNSSDGDLIMTSLPLRAGYRALLPNYVYEEGGLVIDTVAVVGRDTVTALGATRQAWRAEYRAAGTFSTYWIDGRTRQLLRRDIRIRKSGVIMQMLLLPPGGG